MSAAKTFEDYLTNQVPQIDTTNFLINLALSGILATALAWAYSKFSKSQSNRAHFSNNFILTAMTTMLVISVVKSSLALSLGLVGALSIVRFRTAIKDPEELAFLFISISIGLGFGADQRKITLFGFLLIIASYLILRLKYFKKNSTMVMHLILTSDEKYEFPIEDITKIIKNETSHSSLKRVSEDSKTSQISYILEFLEAHRIQSLKSQLKKSYPQLSFNLMEYQGLAE